MLFETYKDGPSWRWRIVARQTRRVIAVSPDEFDSEAEAARTMEGAKRTLVERLSHLDDPPNSK